MGFFDYVLAKAITDSWRDKKEKRQKELSLNTPYNSFATNKNSSKIDSDINKIKKHITPFNNDITPLTYSYDFSYETDFIYENFPKYRTVDVLRERTRCIDVLKNDSNAVQMRCHLVEVLIGIINSYKLQSKEMRAYLIEECRYHLHVVLSKLSISKHTIATKYLLIAIDAELYIIQGNYLDALRCYYRIFDWDRMLNNAYKEESYDYDGTECLYEVIVTNIINIYALLSLPEKADEVRSCFWKIIENSKGSLSGILEQCKTSGHADYVRSCIKGYSSSYMAYGFYTICVDSDSGGIWNSLIYQDPDGERDAYLTNHFVFSVSKLSESGFSYNNWNRPISTQIIQIQRELVKSHFAE